MVFYMSDDEKMINPTKNKLWFIFSTIIKSTVVLEKLTEAVNLGIAYNLEQRSFLAGISDKIATTFNAFCCDCNADAPTYKLPNPLAMVNSSYNSIQKLRYRLLGCIKAA